MPSFIDTHIHIIPGLDDGADSLDIAIEMARMAASDGVQAMIATPHCLNGSYSFEQDEINEAVAMLQDRLDQQAIPVTIHTGAELHSHRQLRRMLDEKKVVTLAGSHYVLLEWPHRSIPDYTDQLIFELVTGGYKPIIAHPERYEAVQVDPNILMHYLERGALVQLTAGSLTGLFGERVTKTARILVEHGMIQLVATDAHGTHGRKPTLSEAYEQARQWVGEERATRLFITNPQAILANAAIRVDAEPYQRQASNWWARLWKRD